MNLVSPLKIMKINEEGLNGVSIILLQFAFPTFKMVPNGLACIPFEDGEERCARKKINNGRQILITQSTVSLSRFAKEILEAGFLMVGAFFQEREMEHKRPYFVVRFSFAPIESVQEVNRKFDHGSFDEGSEEWGALSKLSKEYFWRVRGYENPATSHRRGEGKDFFWVVNAESAFPSFAKAPEKYLVLDEAPCVISRKKFIEHLFP